MFSRVVYWIRIIYIQNGDSVNVKTYFRLHKTGELYNSIKLPVSSSCLDGKVFPPFVLFFF